MNLVFDDRLSALEEVSKHSRADIKKLVFFDKKMGRLVKWRVIPRNRDRVMEQQSIGMHTNESRKP